MCLPCSGISVVGGEENAVFVLRFHWQDGVYAIRELFEVSDAIHVFFWLYQYRFLCLVGYVSLEGEGGV